MPITLIVHGGAKEIPEEQRAAHREGCARACEVGWAVLEQGGSAVEAVEAAIRALEADPTFNAGLGAELNEEGEVQLDAGLMEGTGLEAGAVAYIQGVRHPISIAAKLLYEKETLLVGTGARRFAERIGAELCPKEELVTEHRRRQWEAQQSDFSDTVGCVALDRRGHLAAGASTGGTGNNPIGRVGDTALVGSGYYADDSLGGCSCTGDGESISRVGLARTALELVRKATSPDEAAAAAMRSLGDKTGGDGGCILITPDGRIGWDHNSRDMAVAYRTATGPTRAFTAKAEEIS